MLIRTPAHRSVILLFDLRVATGQVCQELVDEPVGIDRFSRVWAASVTATACTMAPCWPCGWA